MKAVVWHGVGDVRVDNVKDPEILDPKDIIIQVTASGICGSDLHLYDGLPPPWRKAISSAMSPWASSWK